MTERQDAVACEGVSFSYDGAPVLEDVTFTIPAGAFFSIVGPNGGGKTTLLRLLLGLLAPREGRVLLFGLPPREARHRVGYVPQHLHFDPRFPVTVGEVVLMGRLGRRRLGPNGPDDVAVARRALGDMGLEGAWSRPFPSLSGGERQRVLVARALAAEPDLLLLDEPTANADMALESRLFALLQGLGRGVTVVVVSHDLGFVSRYVEGVICVNRRVLVHPVSAVTGEVIRDLYGADLHMVHHLSTEGARR
ncbi:MAG TPA: metal ABC transporter ATP-binding protein [Syntrophales bacterium]|nr:metal ABC transporter ATP-binding protein [Syntrophales bacterium]